MANTIEVMVSNRAIVKGEGRKKRIPLMYRSRKDINRF
tara:strand:+ start:236 stop:349 length:114 start_codon:yes stop_codon:yes gene_type:complete